MDQKEGNGMAECEKCGGNGVATERTVERWVRSGAESVHTWAKPCPCLTDKLAKLTKAVKYGLHVMMPEIHAQRTWWPGEVDDFEDLAKASLEGRMSERLKAIRERLEKATPGPTGNDDGEICAGCNSFVDVREGSEWEDGFLCDPCNTEIADYYREDAPFLLAELERVSAERDKLKAKLQRTHEHNRKSREENDKVEQAVFDELTDRLKKLERVAEAAKALAENAACYSACFIEDEMKGHIYKLRSALYALEDT